MQELKVISRTFLYVLAGSILSTAIFITIFYPGVTFEVSLLWQVIAMAVLTSLGSALFFSKKEISKNQMKFRKIIHYIYINIIVVGTAILCDWVHISQMIQVVVFLFEVSLVYFAVCAIMFAKEEKAAECMNERLRKQYPQEDQEE